MNACPCMQVVSATEINADYTTEEVGGLHPRPAKLEAEVTRRSQYIILIAWPTGAAMLLLKLKRQAFIIPQHLISETFAQSVKSRQI